MATSTGVSQVDQISDYELTLKQIVDETKIQPFSFTLADLEDLYGIYRSLAGTETKKHQMDRTMELFKYLTCPWHSEGVNLYANGAIADFRYENSKDRASWGSDSSASTDASSVYSRPDWKTATSIILSRSFDLSGSNARTQVPKDNFRPRNDIYLAACLPAIHRENVSQRIYNELQLILDRIVTTKRQITSATLDYEATSSSLDYYRVQNLLNDALDAYRVHFEVLLTFLREIKDDFYMMGHDDYIAGAKQDDVMSGGSIDAIVMFNPMANPLVLPQLPFALRDAEELSVIVEAQRKYEASQNVVVSKVPPLPMRSLKRNKSPVATPSQQPSSPANGDRQTFTLWPSNKKIGLSPSSRLQLRNQQVVPRHQPVVTLTNGGHQRKPASANLFGFD